MKKKTIFKNTILMLASALLIVLLVVSSLVYAGGDTRYPSKQSLYKSSREFFLFNINNLSMPLDNKGIIAEVDPGGGSGGKYESIVFLFAGGFFLSGVDSAHGYDMWANGVMSASRIGDYQAGPVGSISTDSKNSIYVLRASDKPFGQAWQDWKDAVALGADWYDGDKDGIYNPVDKNNNGIWDPDEDRPDILGDQTAWCVYNDGIPKAQRRFNDVSPKGIEIRQTLFGFQTKGILGNMLFVRYRIVNKGTVADKFDSVYFSVACDPDLGTYSDDLVGCDIGRSAGYVYNNGPDGLFKDNCPTFLMDFFQGPIVNGSPTDTAINSRGRFIGKDIFPGKKNLPLTSFTQYMQSHPTHGDPNTRFEVRNYMLGGRGKDGRPLDPLKWSFGSIKNPPANYVAIPQFMYHGDPYTGGSPADSGWINNTPQDQRGMLNTGPFVLEKNKYVDIVCGYVVGRDAAKSIASIKVAREYDDMAQTVFTRNFKSVDPPDSIEYTVKTGPGYIDISFPTAKYSTQIDTVTGKRKLLTSYMANYAATDPILQIDRRFQGVYLTAMRTESRQATVAGIENAKEYDHYSMKNNIRNLYSQLSNGGIEITRTLADSAKLLDPAKYGDPDAGRIIMRISEDPFTGTPLIKGKRYYFSLTQYCFNHSVLVGWGEGNPQLDRLDRTNSTKDEFESAIFAVDYGEDMYSPANPGSLAEHNIGAATGELKYVVIDNKKLTGDTYQVEFFQDKTKALYTQFWRLKNVTKGTTLIDSSQIYDYNFTNNAGPVTEGFIMKIKPLTLGVGALDKQLYVTTESTPWITALFRDDGTGAYYCGDDVPAKTLTPAFPGTRLSTVTTFDKARKVEIVFGEQGKAYRYLAAFKGTSAVNMFKRAYYAECITDNDLVDNLPVKFGTKGPLGLKGVGYIDVPFKVYVNDSLYGEKRQLACAIVEKSKLNDGSVSFKAKGNADGLWDPGQDVVGSGEVIIVFNSDYDPTGNQPQYTGKFKLKDNTPVQLLADIVSGYTVDTNLYQATAQQAKTASSPLFDAMYMVALQRLSMSKFYTAGDKFVIPLNYYPYKESDKYTFTTKESGTLTKAEQKEIFNKITVFPNPLFAYNPYTGYDPNANADDPFVTFSNLPPTDLSIKIYSLSGQLIRTLHRGDSRRFGTTSPFLEWNLQNEDGLRVASGMYIAIVSVPGFGDKILKFGIIMPQKQLPRY